jgi:DNA-binding MarR family transcriptional regulator
MNNRPVETCIRILCLLYEHDTNVNSIIKQTSSDRSYVIGAIDSLEKDHLIIEIKDPNHKQKKIKKLAPLGEQLVHLMLSVEKFYTYYAELSKKIRNNLDIPKESTPKIIEIKLRSRGWAPEELKSYEYIAANSYLLEYELYRQMNSALVVKYSLLSFSFHPKGFAKIILDKIVTDSMTHQLHLVLEHFEDVKKNQMFVLAFRRFVSLDSIFTAPRISFIEQEKKDVLTSIISIIEPSKDYVETQINHAKKLIEHIEKGISKSDVSLSELSMIVEAQKNTSDLITKLKDERTFWEELLRIST